MSWRRCRHQRRRTRPFLEAFLAHRRPGRPAAALPDAKLGIGPPITDGFYYDQLDAVHPLRTCGPSRRPTASSRSGSGSCAGWSATTLPRPRLASEPYKLELIDLKGAAAATEGASVEVGAGELTIYDNVRRDGTVAWKDLCRGPHVPDTGYVRVRNHPQLGRCAGAATSATPSSSASTAPHGRPRTIWRRTVPGWPRPPAATTKLGAELDLFSFPEELGAGLPVFHPKGGVLKRVMEDYGTHGAHPRGLRLRRRRIAKEGLFGRRATSPTSPTACSAHG